MLRGCGSCKGLGVLWCSIRDSLAGSSVKPACVTASEVTELAEAKAEMERLREERDGVNERLEIRRTLCQSWEGRCHRTERKLAGAKAEIERLRKELGFSERETKARIAGLLESIRWWKE